MIIFGVDGGADHKAHTKTSMGTGWCTMLTQDHNNDAAPELLEVGQVVGGPDAFLAEFEKRERLYDEMSQANRLIVEGFKLLNARADPAPLEIVGMAKMFGAIERVPVIVRMPSQRTLVSHEDLKDKGMWPGGVGHADAAQAIRHVLSWLIATGHPGTINLFSPDPG